MTTNPMRPPYSFDARQWFPRPIEEVFAFFADATNLERITPPWLRFQVLTPAPIHMGQGTLIDYKLRLRGIPIRWRTLITGWEPPHRFTDEQLRGPYRLWRHTHTFESHDGGTLATDHIDYRVPGGRLIHWLVRPDIQRIFDYRRQAMASIFSP